MSKHRIPPNVLRLSENERKLPEEQQNKIRENIASQIDKAYLHQKPYHYPRTFDEWWEVVNDYWGEIYAIFDRFLPLHEHNTVDGKVIIETLGVFVTNLKEKKDIRLADYTEAAWAAAPDHGSIHAIPGWDVLCDLCSEREVLLKD